MVDAPDTGEDGSTAAPDGGIVRGDVFTSAEEGEKYRDTVYRETVQSCPTTPRCS